MKRIHRLSRRSFIKESLATGVAFSLVPRHVLGAEGQPPPSETLGGVLIGVGGRGPGTYGEMTKSLLAAGIGCNKVADCDVRWVGSADNKMRYTDFRRVLERKDVDVVAIATPPHWHALISIAAMEAGKDVLCEKPMTRTIAEGRGVAEAARRYGRIFQIGTFGRFSAAKDKNRALTRKILKSGLVKSSPVVHIVRGGFKVKEWSGLVNMEPQPAPATLDWDMYCGPSPLKPYHPHRFGGTHRGYWDYENGGMGDMGQHHMDPVTWTLGKDHTAPVEIEAHAPPAHHEACGMWGWAELKYADGTTIVLDSGEWGKPYDRKPARGISLDDLSEEDRKKLEAMPDSEPLLSFGEAVRSRRPSGGNADAAYRTVSVLHLANIAIRTGRKIKFDPDRHEVVGDEEANRLVNQPMRGGWHL
jgi:myo-inositol 2-dehydrogenase / D-chiro-inositol 1-dehydrogenase